MKKIKKNKKYFKPEIKLTDDEIYIKSNDKSEILLKKEITKELTKKIEKEVMDKILIQHNKALEVSKSINIDNLTEDDKDKLKKALLNDIVLETQSKEEIEQKAIEKNTIALLEQLTDRKAIDINKLLFEDKIQLRDRALSDKNRLKEQFDKSIKSNKKPYSFRLDENLMDKLQIYSRLKGLDTVQTLNRIIEKELEDKTVFRGETDKIIPVTNNDKKGIIEDDKDIIGYVFYNNLLDSWNGETYCFNDNPEEHRGLSYLTIDNETIPVLIIKNNNKICSYIINNAVFMNYLNNSDNEDFIMDFIPKDIIYNIKNNPVNTINFNPGKLKSERKKAIDYYNKLVDRQDEKITNLEDENIKLKVLLDEVLKKLSKSLDVKEKKIETLEKQIEEFNKFMKEYKE